MHHSHRWIRSSFQNKFRGNTCSIIILILLILLCACSQSVAEFITPDQAQKAVREFEDDTSLAFDTVKYNEEKMAPNPWTKEERYDLSIGESNWKVDALTGEVYKAFHADAYPEHPDEHPFGKFNQSRCRDIAFEYARSKYKGLDDSFTLETQKWDEDGWSFEWKQYVEYGAATNSGVEVDVNPETGYIMLYNSYRFPIGHPKQPRITKSEAIRLAAEAQGIISVEETYGELQVDPDGKTYYRLEVSGPDAESAYSGCLISVDAITGDCYDIMVGMGMPNLVPGSIIRNPHTRLKRNIYVGVFLLALMSAAILLRHRHSNTRSKRKIPT